MRTVAASLGALFLLAGCGGAPDADSGGDAPPIPDEAVIDAPAEAGDAPGPWSVSPEGAGSVRIGMSLADLVPHLEPGVDTVGLADRCDYLRVPEAPDDLAFMVEAGRLVRIDVRGGDTPSREGARVGDSEARILELYPSARRGPHKYTDGFYLTVLPAAPADTLSRYVFETDGERVTTFRAGVFPPVEYVEGCS